MTFVNFKPGPTSCLFLDRDGVINKRLPGDYVKNVDDLVFLDGSIEAIRLLSDIFPVIVVVTNQQGIGKGLISEENFSKISLKMTEEISAHGGRIDAIYHAPGLAGKDNLLRKPNIGMALKARQDFPMIDFEKSMLVGDGDADMLMGKQLQCVTVQIQGNAEYMGKTNPDYTFLNLLEFAQSLKASLRR